MKSVWLNQNGLQNNYIQPNCKDKLEHHIMTKINNIQQHSPTKKAKRYRSAFTTDQVHYLEKQFKKFPYIGNTHRREVAVALNIPERAVKIWFQNRRMKEKKETSTKECYDDQCDQKSVEFSKEQLSNVIAQSLDDRPVSLVTEAIKPVVENKNYNNSVCNSIKEASLVQNRYLPSVSTKDKQSNDNGAAEFSIDLCKKYTCDSSKPVLGKVFKTDTDTNSEQKTKPQEVLPSVEQLFPVDLSFTKQTSIPSTPQDPTLMKNEHSLNVLNTPGYMSPSVSPMYAQPYITPGGVLWKPINLVSVVPTGLPVLPTSPFQHTSGPADVMRNCNCNCHVQSQASEKFQQNAVNPQYIITAVPYQNPSTKF